MKNCHCHICRALIAILALSFGAASMAPGAEEAPALQEIVVTAQKSGAQNLQDVPMSITALDERTLQQLGAVNFMGYATQIPNLSFSQGSSTVFGGLYVAIRGVYGTDTTGFYLDDTPIPESLNPHLTDIARIEVLRGPQGTLYGARSMGGTVRIITNQPNLANWSGEIHGTVSDTDHGAGNYLSDGVVNAVLVPGKSVVRISAFRQSDSGIFDRVAGVQPALPPDTPFTPFAEHFRIDSSITEGARVVGLVNVFGGRLKLKPAAQFQYNHLEGLPYADSNPGNFTQVRLFNLDEPQTEGWQLYTLNADVPLRFGEIVSSSGLLRTSANESEDYSEGAMLIFGIPPTPALMRYHETLRRFAQETRFNSNFPGPVQMTLGVFYSNSLDTQAFPNDSISGLNAFFGGALGSDVVFNYRTGTTIKEAALFGESTIGLTSRLKLILGARWSNDKVDFAGAESGAAVSPGQFSGDQIEHPVNPKLSLQYELAKGKQVYATVAQGFRIGGVNSFSNTLCAGDLAAAHLTPTQAQSFKSDSLWSYELGAKTSWLDRRVTANGAAFLINWDSVQQSIALPTCGFSVTVNAGKARNEGAELELGAAVTSALTTTLGLGYTDTRIVDNGGIPVIQTGRPLQQIPRWTASIAADYTFEMLGRTAFVHGDYGYTGSSLSANNSVVDPLVRRSYDILNFRSGVTLGSTEIDAFVANAFNKHANFSDTPPLAIELPDRPRIVTNRPRTIGLEARVEF